MRWPENNRKRETRLRGQKVGIKKKRQKKRKRGGRARSNVRIPLGRGLGGEKGAKGYLGERETFCEGGKTIGKAAGEVDLNTKKEV